MNNSFLEFVRKIAKQQTHLKNKKRMEAAAINKNSSINLNVTKNVAEQDISDQQLS